jgi:hypothetical protein
MLFVVQADPSCRGVLPSVYVSMSVIKCDTNSLHLQRVGNTRQENIFLLSVQGLKERIIFT